MSALATLAMGVMILTSTSSTHCTLGGASCHQAQGPRSLRCWGSALHGGRVPTGDGGDGSPSMQIVRGTEMRLRGGISMAEMQKRAAEIPLEGADDDEEQENGVGATFQLVGTGDNSVAVFNLCGERHEVPVANLDMPLLDGQATTALQLAAAEGAIAVVEGLLGLGASSSVGNEDGDTPAHIAAFRGHTKVLEAIHATGAGSIKHRNKHGATPLHAAAASGNDEVFTWLTEHGCDVAEEDDEGFTPEHMISAVKKG